MGFEMLSTWINGFGWANRGRERFPYGCTSAILLFSDAYDMTVTLFRFVRYTVWIFTIRSQFDF